MTYTVSHLSKTKLANSSFSDKIDMRIQHTDWKCGIGNTDQQSGAEINDDDIEKRLCSL
jgi:hypothetical protein